MREQFTNYQSEAFRIELAQFKEIAASLDTNVNKAFNSASNVIMQNFKRLEDGYDKFFDMCKTLSDAVSDNYEEKTASALSLLFNTLVSEFAEIKIQTEKTTEIIEKTSQATEQLCKSVYEFTQYTMAPGFMGKISRFGNFSNRLKEAAEKLISYDKIASLFEHSENKQYEERKKVRKRKINNTGGEQKN